MMRKGEIFLSTVIFLVNFAILLPSVFASSEPLVIGRTLPLTGRFSETAKLLNAGGHYWMETVNAKGGLLGRHVKMIVYDDAGAPDKQLNLLEKLLSLDKVDFAMGGYPTMSVQNQAPILEKYRMVNVSNGGSPTAFMEGFTYCFGMYKNAWGPVPFLDWIEKTPKVRNECKTIAMLTMNNPIGLEGRESVINWAKKMDVKILVDDLYDLPLESADTMMTKVKASKADIFISLSFFDDGVLQVRAAQLFNYQPKLFYQFIGASTPAYVNELGPAAEGTFSHAMACSTCELPGLDTIHKYWEKRYGDDKAPVYFILGYLYLQVLQRGIEGAGNFKQEAVRDYLKSHTISTVIGDVTFGQNGWPNEPVAFNPQIIKGKVENVGQPGKSSAEALYPKPKW